MSLQELSREVAGRRRQKVRIPSGLSCLKRGRVELVLACPLEGTWKERFVSTWEMGPSFHVDRREERRADLVLASTGCTWPRPPRSRDFSVIPLFVSRRRVCICLGPAALSQAGVKPMATPVVSPRCVALHRAGPVMSQTCPHTWACSYAYAPEAEDKGPVHLSLFLLFSPLPRLRV